MLTCVSGGAAFVEGAAPAAGVALLVESIAALLAESAAAWLVVSAATALTDFAAIARLGWFSGVVRLFYVEGTKVELGLLIISIRSSPGWTWARPSGWRS